MKICLTVNSSPWSKFKGGGQLAVHQLACALSSQGQEVHVVYSKFKEEYFDVEVPYEIHWTRHHDVATLNFNIFSYLSVLRPLATKEQFDVIHGNAEEAYFADAVAQKTGASYVFTSHAPHIPRTGMLGGLINPLRFMKNINTYLLRGAVCSAQRIVTFSQFSRNIVVTALGNNFVDRVEVVSPGIDPSWLEVKRNCVPTPHLLFWGRIEEEKGLPELLKAMKNISTKIPETKLTIVGEGSQLQEYKRMVADQGLSSRVEFPGWLTTQAIQQLAAKCSLGVFPSRIESFGLSVVEAMAGGLPILAACAGAIPENVEDGITGTLIPKENPNALTGALIKALKDPERQEAFARKARGVVRQKFSWNVAASKMTKLYKAL